jgi:hypothetical protein
LLDRDGITEAQIERLVDSTHPATADVAEDVVTLVENPARWKHEQVAILAIVHDSLALIGGVHPRSFHH